MFHTKIWLAVAALAATASFSILFSLQQPVIGGLSEYARLLGWTGLTASALLVVQGFWKASRDKQYMTKLRNRAEPNSQDNGIIAEQYTEARVRGWRTMHIILSILVTALATLHGIFLFQRLASPTGGVLVGAIGFGALLVLGLSGVITETRRKSRTFGLLKKTHLWLMVAALLLIEIHAIAAGSTIASLGSTVTLTMLLGTLGAVGVGVEYASIKSARHFFQASPPDDSCEGGKVNFARRAALQKIGTVAVGTLVALSFAEAAALMPKLLPTLATQSSQQLQPTLAQPSPPGQPSTQPAGVKLGNLANISVNSAYYFTDPQGNSNILIRLNNGNLAAYSSTCTHQPCTVGYDNASGLIRCPCHGAVFDPARSAAVLQGPAPAALPSVRLRVDTNGDIWLA